MIMRRRVAEFDFETCMDEHVDKRIVDILMELQNDYFVKLEIARQTDNEAAEEVAKEAYLTLIMSCPVGTMAPYTNAH